VSGLLVFLKERKQDKNASDQEMMYFMFPRQVSVTTQINYLETIHDTCPFAICTSSKFKVWFLIWYQILRW